MRSDMSLYRGGEGSLDNYYAARARIFGEDQQKPNRPRRSQKNNHYKAPTPKPQGERRSMQAGQGTEAPGAVLSLDEIPYDRDLRWYNKASDARPRRTVNRDNKTFSQIENITHNTEEYASLDQHYKLLDKRKVQKDQELTAAVQGQRSGTTRGGAAGASAGRGGRNGTGRGGRGGKQKGRGAAGGPAPGGKKKGGQGNGSSPSPKPQMILSRGAGGPLGLGPDKAQPQAGQRAHQGQAGQQARLGPQFPRGADGAGAAQPQAVPNGHNGFNGHLGAPSQGEYRRGQNMQSFAAQPFLGQGQRPAAGHGAMRGAGFQDAEEALEAAGDLEAMLADIDHQFQFDQSYGQAYASMSMMPQAPQSLFSSEAGLDAPPAAVPMGEEVPVTRRPMPPPAPSKLVQEEVLDLGLGNDDEEGDDDDEEIVWKG